MEARRLKLEFEPHPGQLPLIRAMWTARFLDLIAGIRSGKTHLGIFLILWWAAKLGKKNNSGLIVAQDFAAAEEVIARPMQLMWPEGIIRDYNKNSHIMTLITGHQIKFGSAENVDSLKGRAKVAYAWQDEAALHEEWVHKVVLGRLIDLQGPLLITTTPKYGPGSYWLKPHYERGFNPKYCGDDVPWHRRYFSHHMTTWDNPYLPAEEREVLLDAYSGDEYAQEIEGKFVTDVSLTFRPELLTPERCGYYEDEILGLDLNYYMLVDPAWSETEMRGRCESAILIVGVGPEFGIFVRESWAGRVGSFDLEGQVIRMAQKYRIERAGCEKIGATTLIDNLRRAMKIDTTYQIVELLRAGGQDKKTSRAQRIVPYLESRLLRFPLDAHGNFTNGTDSLVKQMLVFPLGGKLKDRVDTLSDVFNPDMGIIEGVEKPDSEYRRQTAHVPLMSQEEYASFDSDGADDLAHSLSLRN